MRNHTKFLNFVLKLTRNIFILLFFCEFLIYYVVISQCNWNKLKHETLKDGLKAMILADTHMLGPFRGHPFDKLRREWQMQRSFQTAVQLFTPDVVFILGDVFDEGNWVNDEGFAEYVERFRSIFYVPPTTKLYAIHGNHDINFHYQMHPHLTDRFNRAFNTSGVNFIKEKKMTSSGIERTMNFVSINSMALERDNCLFCKEAENTINRYGNRFKKLKMMDNYSAPIVLQHFPNYRKSDAECIDRDTTENDGKLFREKWEVLSRDSTDFIQRTLEPRAYFSGHSHHHCWLKNSAGIDEYTIASFNWRNINNPSFLLAIFTPDDFTVSRCELPKETTVIISYVVGLIISIIFLIFDLKFSKFCAILRIKKTK